MFFLISIVQMFLGADYLSSMDYRGTMFANYDKCNGYMGFVFGYVSHNLFYVVMWRHRHDNWYGTSYRAGIRGIQLKVLCLMPLLLNIFIAVTLN